MAEHKKPKTIHLNQQEMLQCEASFLITFLNANFLGANWRMCMCINGISWLPGYRGPLLPVSFTSENREATQLWKAPVVLSPDDIRAAAGPFSMPAKSIDNYSAKIQNNIFESAKRRISRCFARAKCGVFFRVWHRSITVPPHRVRAKRAPMRCSCRQRCFNRKLIWWWCWCVLFSSRRSTMRRTTWMHLRSGADRLFELEHAPRHQKQTISIISEGMFVKRTTWSNSGLNLFPLLCEQDVCKGKELFRCN